VVEILTPLGSKGREKVKTHVVYIVGKHGAG